MPKMKIKRGATKRLRVTGTGKIVGNHSGLNHILTKKNNKRKRRLHKTDAIPAGARKRLRRVLGV